MSKDDAELQFVADNEVAIPKEKLYLLKYFKTPIQQRFVSYYFLYGNYSHFVEHTGYRCSMRWLHLMRAKMEKIESLQVAAKKNFDLDALADIENGKYRWTCDKKKV